MPITSADIKLFNSQRMADTPDGGGYMTPVEVVDGQLKNVFDSLSDMDGAYGNVSMRKVFLAVMTDGQENYYGANAIIADVPDDPLVSVALFSTKDWTDERDAARTRVESYLSRGPKFDGYLWEQHIEGQRAILVLMRTDRPAPPVGGVLVVVKNAGQLSEESQYVRITEVDVEKRTFDYGDRSFVRNVVTLALSDPLQFDVNGGQPRPDDELGQTLQGKLYSTVVANAANYYGTRPLAEPVTLNAVSLKADTVFHQLVPSAQSETPIVDASAAADTQPVIDASGQLLFTYTALPFAANTVFYIGSPVLPGTLDITVTGGYLFDKGGRIVDQTEKEVGTIDYQGVLTFHANSPTYGGSKTVKFKPAAVPIRVADSASIQVESENRGYIYTMTLYPSPAPGALVVSYMAQGQWYDLRDQGNGTLKGGESAYGAGNVSYVTGTCTVSCGALPDAGSEIIFTWGTNTAYFNRSGMAVEPVWWEFTLGHTGIAPGTLAISWPATSGPDKTASDDDLGNITGNASGTVDYATGVVKLKPNSLPLAGTVFTFEYDYGTGVEETFPNPARGGGGAVTLTLNSGGAIVPGTVVVEWNTAVQDLAVTETVQNWANANTIKRDDWLGALSGVAGSALNYSNGTLVFNPDITVSVPVPSYQTFPMGYKWELVGASLQLHSVWRNVMMGIGYESRPSLFPTNGTGTIKVRYRPGGSSTAASETHVASNPDIDLTDRFAEHIVPGSVRFTFGGKTYVDRFGSLYHTISNATGAGVFAGSIDYATGICQISNWLAGQPNDVALEALLTEVSARPVDELVFRIPVSPVRPGSVQIRANQISGGALVTATAATNGIISTAAMDGKVNYETGVVRVRFGQWVAAAGNEAEPWYDAGAVFSGQIFKPLPVHAYTLRYNAVAYTYLPLDPDLLGLDPVRLPSDGRVPIFKAGSLVVIHNTQTVAPATYANGNTVNMGRERISSVRVYDNASQPIAESRYTTDLDAGTLTFTNVGGLSQPLTIEHRIEDMALLSDAQIDGKMTVTRQISHAYPANTSYVSSAYPINTLITAVVGPSYLDTWLADWNGPYDAPDLLARYNDILYPIQVKNNGAAQERWVIIFTGTTTFKLVGETVGQIAVGSIYEDFAPINPATGNPYFKILLGGWGLGWAVGNAVRFDTTAANHPLWLVRTVKQGIPSLESDSFRLLIRGNAE